MELSITDYPVCMKALFNMFIADEAGSHETLMLLTTPMTVHVVTHEDDQQCAAVRKQMVPASLKVVDEIDAYVEPLPSDEASYLQKEYIASMPDHGRRVTADWPTALTMPRGRCTTPWHGFEGSWSDGGQLIVSRSSVFRRSMQHPR